MTTIHVPDLPDLSDLVSEEVPSEIRGRADRIERLLDDIQAVAGPVAWPRVERLVSALVDLYGSGLERLLECARVAARSTEELNLSVTEDELVSGLLLLHGFHPVPIEERVAKALEWLHREKPNAAILAFVGVENDIVVVRVVDPNPSAELLPVSVIARAIELEAPEVTGLRIEGLAPLPAPASALVSVERLVRGGKP